MKNQRDIKHLQQTIKFYETLLRVSNDGILITDASHNIIEVNNTFCSFIGQKREAVIESDLFMWLELFLDDAAKNWINLERKVQSKQTVSHFEFQLKLSNKARYFDVNASLFEKIEKEEQGIIISNWHEITERKETEEELKAAYEEQSVMVEQLNEALLDTEKARDNIDAILKSIADGLIVTDTQNRVLLMNHAAEDLLDIRFSEVIGQPINFIIKEKTLLDKILYTLRKKNSEGYQFDFELPGENPKQIQFMRAHTSVIQSKGRTETGIVIIFRDVTYEKEVDRMKTEFLSTAAHELRTPLTSILGFAEILLTRKNLDQTEKEKFLSYIHKQAEGLAHIINDLLDVSRIEARRGFSLAKKMYDIQESIKKNLTYFEAQNKIHQFEVDIKDKNEKLLFDRGKIEQALKNLIDNAIKYSPEGGIIRVEGKTIGKYFQISVEDQGIGMKPEHLEKIFEKFYRVHTANSAPSGTGLGMTIVKYIVESHGGKIKIQSKFGKGTKVMFTIPRGTQNNTWKQEV